MITMPEKTSKELLEKQRQQFETVKFNAIVENEAAQIGFGTITFNVLLKNSVPLIKTLNVVRQRRRKYPQRRGEVSQLIKITKSFVTLPR